MTKPLTQSRTVYAAAGTVIAYFATRYGLDPELADAILVIGAALVAVFMRSGINTAAAALIMLTLFTGCCSRPDLRPTVRLAAEEFAQLRNEARDGLIRLSADEAMNAELIEARIERLAKAHGACIVALREGAE